MKSHLIYFYITLTILFIGIIFTGCSKCDGHDTYYNLSYSIPYKQGDVLKFTDTLGNKLTFTLFNSTTGYYLHSGAGECEVLTDHKQYNNIFFTETNNKATLFIGNYKDGDSSQNLGEHVTICINGFDFSYYTDWIINRAGDIPQITLNGKIYTNVCTPRAASWTGKQVYYSKQFGFKTDSIQWYLDN